MDVALFYGSPDIETGIYQDQMDSKFEALSIVLFSCYSRDITIICSQLIQNQTVVPPPMDVTLIYRSTGIKTDIYQGQID